MHEKKQHGLSKDIFPQLLESDVNLFIIADSSTNDIKQQRKLLKEGKDIIILDHHIKEGNEFVEEVCLVNNQLKDSISNNLSGVGVVEKFIKANGYNTDKYLDLVAVGLIADAMNTLSLENRYYINKGLNNINNEVIKEFFKYIKNPIIENVSFNLANYMNSVIRYGAFEEKELLWKAMIGEEGVVEYKKRNGQTVQQTLQEAIKRISGNVKNRQNNSIKNSVKLIEKEIYKNKLDADKCIIIKNDELIDKGLTGITAQKLLSKFKRPIIIVGVNESDELIGSMRSPFDFKDILNESNLVTFAQGHSKACGIGIKEINIDKLRKYLNIKLKDFNLSDEKIEEVDYIFDGKDIKIEVVKEIGDLRPLWGRNLEEPTFIIKNAIVDSIKIKYKKEGICYIATFKYNDIIFKKEFCSKDTYEQLIRKQDLKFGKTQSLNLTLLCKFKKSDNGSYYVSIEDFNSVKSSKLIF